MHWLEKLALRTTLRETIQRRFEAPRVLGALRMPAGGACLEVGCGHGFGTLLILRHLRPARVVGVDVDPDMLAAARRRLTRPPRWARDLPTERIELVQAGAEALPFRDATFDAVVFFFVLDHVPDRVRAFAEVRRVLKPAGVLTFEEMLIPDHPLLLNRVFGHVSFTRDDLRLALQAAGLEILRLDRLGALPVCLGRARRGS